MVEVNPDKAGQSPVKQQPLHEVDRLYDSRGMMIRGGAIEFNRGWVPDSALKKLPKGKRKSG